MCLPPPYLLLIAQKLDSSSARVSHSPGELRGLPRHFSPRLFSEEDGGGLLDHLLITPLDGALPLGEAHDVVVDGAVREELDFDVVRPLDEFLYEDPVVVEAVRVEEGGRAKKAAKRFRF